MDDFQEQPDWGIHELRRAVRAAGVALWTWNVDTDVFLMDPQGYRLWDLDRDGALTFEQLSAKIHPADRDRVRAAFSATRAVIGPYESISELWSAQTYAGFPPGVKAMTKA